MINLEIQLDNELKEQAEKIALELGLDLTTAIRIFLTQMVNDRAFPFRPSLDQFYSPSNQAALSNSLTQLNNGEIITKTLAELMDNQ